MKLTKEQVAHVASLARLSLTEEEVTRLTEEMTHIIGFAEKLNELDVTGVEPTAHAIPMVNVFRADEVKPSYPREKILQNAPTAQDGGVLVPKIVE